MAIDNNERGLLQQQDELQAQQAEAEAATLIAAAAGGDAGAIEKLRGLMKYLRNPADAQKAIQAGEQEIAIETRNAVAATVMVVGAFYEVSSFESRLDLTGADPNVLLTFKPEEKAESPKLELVARDGQTITIGDGFAASGRTSAVVEGGQATVVVADQETNKVLMEAIANGTAEVHQDKEKCKCTVHVHNHQDPNKSLHIEAANVQLKDESGQTRDVHEIRNQAESYRRTCSAMGHKPNAKDFAEFMKHKENATPRHESGELPTPQHQVAVSKSTELGGRGG